MPGASETTPERNLIPKLRAVPIVGQDVGIGLLIFSHPHVIDSLRRVLLTSAPSSGCIGQGGSIEYQTHVLQPPRTGLVQLFFDPNLAQAKLLVCQRTPARDRLPEETVAVERSCDGPDATLQLELDLDVWTRAEPLCPPFLH